MFSGVANFLGVFLFFNDTATTEIYTRSIVGSVGVWIDGNEEIESVAEQLVSAPVVAIRFPKFVDGRGFSVARLLRECYQYQGEIRAIGEIIRDQLYLLQRCGFNAFEFGAEVNIAEASKSLADFSDAYQVAVDQPVPLFKRR